MRFRLAILPLLAVALLFTAGVVRAGPPLVRQITFTGNEKTRTSRMLDYMCTKVGRPYDEKTLARDVDMLKSWMYFEYVKPTVEETPEGVAINIDLKEKWTVIPEVDVQYGGGAYLFKLGVKDTNFLGYREEVMGYGGWRAGDWLAGGRFVEPRIAGSIVGFRIEGGRNFYEDPHYQPVPRDVRPDVSFLAERLGGEARLEFEAHDLLRVGIPYRFTADHLTRVDGYPEHDEKAVAGWLIPKRDDSAAAGVWLKAGRVNFDNYIYSGVSLETMAYYYSPALGGDLSFGKVQGDFRFYVPAKWQTNFAGKLFAGYENSDSFIEQYTLGGLDSLRGYPDRRYRGQAISYLNLEYRWMAFTAWWFSFMFDACGDAGAAWNKDTTEFHVSEDVYTSLGGGIRLIVNKWDYAVIRFDVAWPFATEGPLGFIFGMDMFF
jgi:outer membrane protein assembly factor BamA